MDGGGSQLDPTQCTQGAMDPRRMGLNNSGLTDEDISGIMCILHPCSPAAFTVVEQTADRSPQHVLQNDGQTTYEDLTQSALEEQETFILNGEGSTNQAALDLALRFDTDVINPTLGFVFGRNRLGCDIVLASETHKRVSNMHFGIYMNESGVLMLRDMSTNGTLVDNVLLQGKTQKHPQTRMLSPGSIIQILSPKSDEVVKFIVRIPPRDGHEEQFELKFEQYRQRIIYAQALQAQQDKLQLRQAASAPGVRPHVEKSQSHKAPILRQQHTMHWNGGEKYNVVGLIGKGAFATVHQLATKSEGQLFAAKELEKRKFMKNGVLDRKLDNEMQIMKAISHPNIVQYVDYADHANHLYIIMEFVPCGDLQQYLQQQGPLPQSLGKTMAMQVLDALNYLHAKKITHRDIKPDNILIANMEPDAFTVKLSDFGLSKVVTDNDTFLKTFCGTLLYCAPEVFPHYDAHVAGRGQKRTRRGSSQPPTRFHSYSQSVDVWSFGAVLWYALCLRPPFEGVADNTGRGMFEKIMMTPLDQGDLVVQGVNDVAIDLLVRMLNTDPASRPLPRECLRHPWLARHPAQFAEQRLLHGDPGMFAIDEEEETELAKDPDLSQLSLNEQVTSHYSGESHFDEASIHSGSMNFFDPRQSKRLKSEAFAYREKAGDFVDSSPELFHQSIDIACQPDHATGPSKPPPARKLFGEISQSALNAPDLLKARTSAATGSDGSNDGRSASSGNSALEAQRATMAVAGAVASPSLLGAESLMRDVHMQSPHGSQGSLDAVPNEQNVPITPEIPQAENGELTNGKQSMPDEITPKPPQPSRFSRQINIAIPPSFWFDPADATTHTEEYAASRMSQMDPKTAASFLATSRPATASGSTTDHDGDEHAAGDADGDLKTSTKLPVAEKAFVKPPPRLGTLVATPDSFARITLNLTKVSNTWGRADSNTLIHPNRDDILVPKHAFDVCFHAPGLEPAAEDWYKTPGLHCSIKANSYIGIYVNGVKLGVGSDSREPYGRIYTGDEITIWEPMNGKPGLKFRCEFFHGEAKNPRPDGVPRFKIEHRRRIEPLPKPKARTEDGKKDGIKASKELVVAS